MYRGANQHPARHLGEAGNLILSKTAKKRGQKSAQTKMAMVPNNRDTA